LPLDAVVGLGVRRDVLQGWADVLYAPAFAPSDAHQHCQSSSEARRTGRVPVPPRHSAHQCHIRERLAQGFTQQAHR